MTTLVLAPNWLGDAVMALPSIADIRRHPDTDRLVVAARPGVAGLLTLVPGIDASVTLDCAGIASIGRFAADARTLRETGADVAILLPNAIHAALLTARAGIPRRAGYSRDLRRLLLTQAVAPPPRPVHQIDEYRHLVRALGYANGPREPYIEASATVEQEGRRLLAAAGWNPEHRLIGFGPGAAYGGAKRWPADRYAAVIASLIGSPRAACVLLGSDADRPAACAIEAELGRIGVRAASAPVIDLTGQTSLAQLAGVLVCCASFVSNDSGAMHLAAALGVPVVAVFGPTDDRGTAPVGRSKTTMLTAPAWCRPCMLRECPLDHRCMTGIGADRVLNAIGQDL